MFSSFTFFLRSLRSLLFCLSSLLSPSLFAFLVIMTVTIKAGTLPGGTDPNAVAGASAGSMHELTNKLHETV